MLSWLKIKQKKPNLLGLDIGNADVKLMELAQQGENFQVVNCVGTPLTSSNDKTMIVAAIQRVVTQLNAQTKAVAIAVPDDLIISKVVQVDAVLSRSAIEAQVISEAERYFSYPLSELSIDFQILEPSTTDRRFLDVLLVATQTKHINTRVALAKTAGLSVKVIDVESHAIERAYYLQAKIAGQISPDWMLSCGLALRSFL